MYACEVLFNRGICRLYLGKIDAGLTDLYHAQKSKMTEEHEVIDQAVRDRGKGYSVFSIPVGVLYRPPESRLRQMHGNVDMFAAVDKLGLNKFQKPMMMAAAATAVATTGAGLGRNNSVLLSNTKFQRKQSLGFSSLGAKSIPMRHTTSQQQQQHQPLSSSSSSSSSMSSNYNSPPPPPMMDPIPVASASSHYPRNHYPPAYPQHQQQNNSNNSIPLSTSSSSSLSSVSAQQQYRHHNTTTEQQQRTRKNSNPLSNFMHSQQQQQQQQNDEWTDTMSQPSSSTSSFTSSLRYRTDGRRVDSGFESSHEDRFSYSSRNSAKSHKTNRYSPPPVPPIPKPSSSSTIHQQQYVYEEEDVFDPMSYSRFDHQQQQQDNDEGALAHEFQQITVEDERDRIRHRLTPHNDGRRTSDHHGHHSPPHPSTSTSSSTLGGSKIKIKVHYNDTRVILVPSTTTFDELIHRVRDKLHAPPHTRLQYKDEDNEMVLMIDDDDLQMARQIHRVRHTQDLGVEKMEIWCIT